MIVGLITRSQCSRLDVEDQVAARLAVPYRDTLRVSRLGLVQTAEAVDRVITQIAIYVHTRSIGVIIQETVDILARLAVVFLRVPHRSGLQQTQGVIRTGTGTERQIFITADFLFQPNALDGTGIILVIQSFTRRTPHRSGDPYSRVVGSLVVSDGIFAGLGKDGIYAQIITMTIIQRGERHIRIGRYVSRRVIHITARSRRRLCAASGRIIAVRAYGYTREHKNNYRKTQPFEYGCKIAFTYLHLFYLKFTMFSYLLFLFPYTINTPITDRVRGL